MRRFGIVILRFHACPYLSLCKSTLLELVYMTHVRIAFSQYMMYQNDSVIIYPSWVIYLVHGWIVGMSNHMH